jgi:DNA-binding LacI/PurR family transcriptional regulator
MSQPTVREVARLAGVSAMTVSRALSGRGCVAADTARRVQAAVRRLRYRPNLTARLLRSRESRLVGVTIPSLTSSVHRGIVAGVEEVLGPAGYQLLLGHLGSGSRRAASFLHAVERQPCDGYVIVPSRVDAERARAPRLDRPVVVALADIPGLDTDRVLADGAAAATRATCFLAERFGGPIAFVNTRSRLSHDQALLRGYRRALRALGERERVLLLRPDEDCGRKAVSALLAGADPPRGLLLASSLVVFDGLAALGEHGRKLGEDIGVVAVASEERPWTALLPIPLPLLEIPARDIGRRAATRLLERLRGGDRTSRTTLTVPVEFLAGDHPR